MFEEKYICAYVRISSEDKLKSKIELSQSIYNQLSVIKMFAKNIGLTINKEYIDDGYSGINFDRPGFEKLKEDIEKNKVAVIITKDFSRLGRNFIETAYYITEYFEKYNIRYISINDQYDSEDNDNSLNDIILEIKSIINDRYVKDTSDKRKQVAILKTKNGEFIGGIAPYGYKVVKVNNKRTLEIDENASNVVKRIFTEIASGKTRREVAEMLNKEKILPPVIYMKMTTSKDKKYYYDWTDKIVYRIVKNKAYTGKIVVRKSIKLNYKQKKRDFIPIRDREAINNTHPAIISDELFQEANSNLKELRRKEKNDYDGVFSGLVVCGECGRIMSVCRVRKENGKVKYYFACNNSINRKKCDNRSIYDSKLKSIVKYNLKELIDNYVHEEKVIENVSKNVLNEEKLSFKIASIRKDLEIHNNNIKSWYFKKTQGEISLEEFMDMKSKEMNQIEIKESLLKNLVESNNIEMKKQEILDKYNNLINNDIFSKEYIEDLIKKIIIYKDNTIEIVFNFGVANNKKIKLY